MSVAIRFGWCMAPLNNDHEHGKCRVSYTSESTGRVYACACSCHESEGQ